MSGDNCRNWFSPSSTWVPGMELGLSGFVTNTSICCSATSHSAPDFLHGYSGLNPRPHTCNASAPLTESSLQTLHSGLFFKTRNPYSGIMFSSDSSAPLTFPLHPLFAELADPLFLKLCLYLPTSDMCLPAYYASLPDILKLPSSQLIQEVFPNQSAFDIVPVLIFSPLLPGFLIPAHGSGHCCPCCYLLSHVGWKLFENQTLFPLARDYAQKSPVQCVAFDGCLRNV